MIINIINMKLNTKDKQKIGIYVIRNTINNKVYVGKSVNIYIRMKTHITNLNRSVKDENIHLINSWHKYGSENFEYFVVEYLETEELLSERELYWITEYDSLNRDKGYNLRLDSSGGMIPSDETRERLSEALRKRYQDPKEREKTSKAAKKFWENNPEIKEEMAKKVALKKRKYRIGKFNKQTDELIKVYEVIAEIEEEHPEFYLQAIKGCCSGTKKSVYGFNWHYVALDSEEVMYKNKI